MNKIVVYKASPITRKEPVEDMVIEISKELPEPTSLADWAQVVKHEATTICTALCNSLPQGVVHELTVQLLARKVDLYIGKMP